MEVILNPEFSDLFPGEIVTAEELLLGVPSRLTIQLMALIGAELYSNDQGLSTQGKIMEMLMAKQSPQIRAEIVNRAFGGLNRHPGETTYFFTASYCMNFMHYEIVHFRELPDEDLTPAQELNVFKAYFLIAEQYAKENKKDNPEIQVDDEHYFGKMMWPALLDQFEVCQPVNPYLMMLRGVVFLNYLQFHSEYTVYVENYLRQHGKPTVLHYVLDIFQILLTNYKSIGQGGTGTSSFAVKKADGFESIFNQFTLNVAEYQTAFGTQKSNYTGIKSKPLFRLNDDTWIVLNWSFLQNKMYEGLLFDFYEHSGIREIPHFNKYPHFKSFVGGKITEEYLVRKLLRSMFRAKYQILLFDEQKTDGFPDAYYRIGNEVFLFEIKDAYFPASVVNSFSYEKIIQEIDKKMNSKGKGTGQLVKQIQRLSKTPFETPQRYKHARNLEIFPVIIYGDIFFNIPGINAYLEQSFRKQIKETEMEVSFKKIHALTFINISFLIQHFDQMQTPRTCLGSLIRQYTQFLAKSEKKFNRTHEMVDHFEMHSPFEQVAGKLMHDTFGVRDYVKASMEALDITEGLPNS
jgi:hypothetical protein